MTLKIHSTEAERLAEYLICKERGHSAGLNFSTEGWKICKFCGTHFDEKRLVKVVEKHKPEGAE